ncbi:acyl-coenzyme A amino acid N-acyltransferase 1-like [Haliotis rufescens]|uniref:acyl-coenzyme A amino acid N-acyltransferase 1-like n=1 Tax=Haliotis rufescens TaxID=6454 RepID=UPI00201F1244|nr:acyl-coenzyme A amino acid N-acyltransferase 1-like [Haliotis rufescens]
MVCVNVSPRVALVDERVSITVTGLRPVQRVTVQSWLKQGEAVFRSNAHFLADGQGQIDVSHHVSYGGTYRGVDSMGLFRSMKPVPGASRKTRILKDDVMTPLVFTLSVMDGHIAFDDLQLPRTVELATGELERWYKHPTVHRIVVREGPLRGTLFLPPGEGPFPGLIDMSGSIGGLVEYRAALLASRGFACFALSYFRYDDLPSSMADIDFDYILGAVDWLASHPHVQVGGIGVIGASKGGEVAFLLGMTTNKIRCSCQHCFEQYFCDNTACKLNVGDILMLNTNNLKYTDEGVYLKDNLSYGIEVIPAWKNNAQILYLLGEDDGVMPIDHAKYFIETCPEEKRKNIELVSYPGTGHRIEPPYMPMYRTLYHPVLGMTLVVGGHPEAHAAAEEDAWRRLLNFLHKHLPH